MKPVIVRVKRNVYGNYLGYVGRYQIAEAAGMDEWRAKEWLCNVLDSDGYALSDKSDINTSEVEAHRKATR